MEDKAFLTAFGEKILIGGEEKVAIFDPGSREERTIRGTKISETRPFILAPEAYDLLEGDEVQVRGQTLYIADVEHHEGMVTAFLGSEA
jgi:hypothetical protein